MLSHAGRGVRVDPTAVGPLAATRGPRAHDGIVPFGRERQPGTSPRDQQEGMPHASRRASVPFAAAGPWPGRPAAPRPGPRGRAPANRSRGHRGRARRPVLPMGRGRRPRRAGRWRTDARGHAVLPRERHEALHRRRRSAPLRAPPRRARRAHRRLPAPRPGRGHPSARRHRPQRVDHGPAPPWPHLRPGRLLRGSPEGRTEPRRAALQRGRPGLRDRGGRRDRARAADPVLPAATPGRRPPAGTLLRHELPAPRRDRPGGDRTARRPRPRPSPPDSCRGIGPSTSRSR
jgi:hypothetical protein